MRTLHRVLLRVFAGAVAIRLLMWGVLITLVIGVRGDIGYPEGARVYAVDRVAQGKPLYQDFRHPPHIMVPYGPAYFYVAGTISRFCVPDPFRLYAVSRAVSLGAFLLLIGLCFLWARDLVSGWGGAILIAAFAGACPRFLGPCVGAQVDSMAVLASTGCLWVATRRWGPWRWLLTWGLAMLAWSTKQNAVAVAPTLAVWLLETRGWKPAIQWLVAWLAGIIAIWCGFDWATNGLFTLNAVISLVRPLDWVRGAQIVRESLPVVGVAFGVAASYFLPGIRSESLRVPAWWFFFSAVHGIASCFGEGGGANYLFESWIPACLLCSRLFSFGNDIAQIPCDPMSAGREETSCSLEEVDTQAGVRSGNWVSGIPMLGLALLILCCLRDTAVVFSWGTSYRTDLVRGVTTRVRLAGYMPNLLPVVTGYPGEVFIQYTYLALASKRVPAVLDVVHYRLLVDAGVISADALVDQISRSHYELMVLRWQLPERYDPTDLMRWPEPVWRALSENYFLMKIVDSQCLYVPSR